VIHPTAVLVFQELPATGRLEPPPRGRRARFFSAAEWMALLGIGVLLAAIVAGGYVRSAGEAGNVAHGRSMALAVLTAASAAMTAALSGLRTRMAWLVTSATLGLSVALVQTPMSAAALHVAPLHLDDWALAAAAGALAGVLALGLDRAARRRRRRTLRPSGDGPRC